MRPIGLNPIERYEKMYSEEDLILQLAGLGTPPPEVQGMPAGASKWGIANYPLASVYAPIQQWRDAYDEEMALSRGTLFRELDKPFLGKEV